MRLTKLMHTWPAKKQCSLQKETIWWTVYERANVKQHAYTDISECAVTLIRNGIYRCSFIADKHAAVNKRPQLNSFPL